MGGVQKREGEEPETVGGTVRGRRHSAGGRDKALNYAGISRFHAWKFVVCVSLLIMGGHTHWLTG